MKKSRGPASPVGDASEKIAVWVGKLQEAQRHLQELTGGGSDAVLSSGGHSYLLQAAQDKLRESEEQFRNMFNAAAIGIAVSTPQGRFLQVNAAYCRMLGYTEEELLTRDFASLTHPDDLTLNLQMRDELLAGQRESFIMEKRYLKKNGEIVWTRHSVSATHAAGGEIGTLMVVAEDITERKKAEEELALFRTLVDRSPDSIEVIDPETGRFLAVNTTGCARLGYSLEEMRSLTLADIDVERDYRLLWPVVVEEVKKAGYATILGRHRRKDGSSFPVEVNTRYLELNRGYMVAVVRDITERKRVEAELQRKQTELQVLFDLIPAMVWFKDTNNVFLRVNQRGADAAGRPVEEIEGKSAEEIFPQDAAKFYADDLEVINSRAPKLGIIEILRNRDGQEIWVQTDKVPFFNQAGEVDGILVMVQDISERIIAEGRMRRLMDSNVQGVFFWNTNGRILDANDSFLGMVGYTREDLKAGRINWATMTPPEYAELDRRALEECATREVCKPYEKEYQRKDGTRVPILLGAARFDDKPDEGVCFVLDLTERKKLEQQFMRAQRMESIGTLAGGVAHDLNNILAPIMMSIELLKEMSDKAEAQEVLATIEVSARQGADIVRQVLSFARGLDGERIEIQPKHLLQDLENIIRSTFPKNIQLEFRVPSEVWTILGDPTQVHQVLLNLSLNARDAMPVGGNLTIAVENRVLDEHYAAMNSQAKAGRYVQINVTDSGTGIPPEVVDRIFDPFFTTKEMGKGTGLGLSTVMAIVKSHEGFINVYTEPGRGTTFTIYLPAIETTLQADKMKTQRASLPRGNHETVLVVDDEDSILNITVQTLQSFGYVALTAKDGAEAVAVYVTRKDEIAVVLTDMMMPVMDGAAMIHALTRINPAVKIIAASGLANNSRSIQALPAKVKHFLAKPYTAETLLNMLQTILQEA